MPTLRTARDLQAIADLQYEKRRTAMVNARAAKAKGLEQFAREFYLQGARLLQQSGRAYQQAAAEARRTRRPVDVMPFLQAQIGG